MIQKKSLILYLAMVLVLCLTAWHVLKIAVAFFLDPTNAGIDFYAYYVTSLSLLEGKNPFDAASLLLKEKWSVLPIIFPPQMVLLSPFTLFPPALSQLAFFAVNLAAACGLFLFFFHRYVLLSGAIDRVLSLCLFLNTMPVLLTFAHGQITNLAFLCFFTALLSTKELLNAALLAIAVALKYSLYPFLGCLFLLQKRFKTCLIAVGLLLILLVSPILFFHNLYTLYTDYLSALMHTVVDCGLNTYCGGGSHYLVNLDFFKANTINIIFKLYFVGALLLAFRREYGEFSTPDRTETPPSLPFLFLVTNVTMVFSYHRVYDLTATVLIAIALAHDFLKRRQWVHLSITGLSILVLLIPFSLMLQLADIGGAWMGESRWFYLTQPTADAIPVIPLYGIYTFLLTLYSTVLYFSGDRKCT